MINKEKLPEFIDRFNRNDLHGKDLEEFLEMLKNDPQLQLEVKLDKDLNEILAESDVIELRRKLIKYRTREDRTNHGLALFLFAASVAIIIGLGILAFLWIRKTERENMNVRNDVYPADTINLSRTQSASDEITNISSIKDRENRTDTGDEGGMLLADNYLIFPPYESLVNETNRTGDFRLLEPSSATGHKKGSGITFTWETLSIDKVTISITNNKGQNVFISKPMTGKSFTYGTSNLSEGLYYFKFIHDDEIVYFGKFTLE